MCRRASSPRRFPSASVSLSSSRTGPGAGGNIAAEAAAKADPDGYTLLMSTSTTFATNPNLYKSLPFNVQTDFAPITLTAFIPNLLVVNPSVPASNVAEFDRLPEGQSRQVEFRLGRQRLLAAYRRRVVQFAGRRAHDAHRPIAAARRP